MNAIDNICTAFTIGCSIYTSLTVYKNIKFKKVSAVEHEDEAFRNTRDYYETVSSGNSSVGKKYSLRDTNGSDKISEPTEFYKNKIQDLQKKLTKTTFIVNKNTYRINDLNSIVRDQQKCIEELRLVNNELLLKLNDSQTEMIRKDETWFIKNNIRTNNMLKELNRKISTLKRENATKKELKKLKKNFTTVKKNIMTTQSVHKNHFDEKISNMLRKYNKLKIKRDMMSFHMMSLNFRNSVPNIPMERNGYIPETSPVEASYTPSVAKIPVPPPMPVIPVPPPMPVIPVPPPMPVIPVPPPMPVIPVPPKMSSTSPEVSVVSVKPLVPPVPLIPPNTPALPLDDYCQFPVTKHLLKTITLTPPNDTPKKIKKPQCMIDASKRDVDG